MYICHLHVHVHVPDTIVRRLCVCVCVCVCVQALSTLFKKTGRQADEYTHYADPKHEGRTPLQSILLKMKEKDLLECLTVYLLNTNANVNFYSEGQPPLHMAIEVCM